MKPGDASGQQKETMNSEKMKRINNKQAASYVESQIPFQANNIHGQNEGDWFVVYSYGEHFPMYAWKAGLGWQGNKDKYSVTTSRHQNQVRPDGINAWHSTEELKALIQGDTSSGETSNLQMASLVAGLGSVFCKTANESNAWKKRMLATVPGIDFPEDFDALPESEKQARLDKAITTGKGSE